MQKAFVEFQPIDSPTPIKVEVFVRGYHEGLPMCNLRETFHLKNRFLGAWMRYWFRTNGDRLAQGFCSRAFFCQACGDIWGRRVTIPNWWSIESRPCQAHGNGSFIEGNESDMEFLPPQVIAYEFILRTNHA